MDIDNNIINCPECGKEINVSDILYHQVQDKLSKNFEAKNAQKDKDLQKKLKDLQTEKEQLAKDKETIQQKVNSEVKSKLTAEKTKLEKSIRNDLKEETSEQIQSLTKELELKSRQVKELNKTKAEVEKLKREKDELRDTVVLEKEKEFTEKLKDEKIKIKKQVDEVSTMKIKELEKQLEVQKKLAEEMKRKAEQGSMQLQGEVQELALEKLLRNTYPFDNIDEIGKGIRGADCIQTVINSLQQSCGSIVYESKRTKNFSNDWINKLKQDQIICKADIAVIVTETFPSDMDRFGEKDGVWICGFSEVKSVSFVLREMLLKTQSVKTSDENKGDKMELLYSYLTSNEFVQNIKRIVENYDAMIQQLNYEKKAMFKNFATREKQIWVVQKNINVLFGSIKGIAGKELETSSILELPNATIDE